MTHVADSCLLKYQCLSQAHSSLISARSARRHRRALSNACSPLSPRLCPRLQPTHPIPCRNLCSKGLQALHLRTPQMNVLLLSHPRPVLLSPSQLTSPAADLGVFPGRSRSRPTSQTSPHIQPISRATVPTAGYLECGDFSLSAPTTSLKHQSPPWMTAHLLTQLTASTLASLQSLSTQQPE